MLMQRYFYFIKFQKKIAIYLHLAKTYQSSQYMMIGIFIQIAYFL